MAVYRVCERHEFFVEAENKFDALEKAATAASRLTFADETVLATDYDNTNTWVETFSDVELYENFEIAE